MKEQIYKKIGREFSEKNPFDVVEECLVLDVDLFLYEEALFEEPIDDQFFFCLEINNQILAQEMHDLKPYKKDFYKLNKDMLLKILHDESEYFGYEGPSYYLDNTESEEHYVYPSTNLISCGELRGFPDRERVRVNDLYIRLEDSKKLFSGTSLAEKKPKKRYEKSIMKELATYRALSVYLLREIEKSLKSGKSDALRELVNDKLNLEASKVAEQFDDMSASYLREKYHGKAALEKMLGAVLKASFIDDLD